MRHVLMVPFEVVVCELVGTCWQSALMHVSCAVLCCAALQCPVQFCPALCHALWHNSG